MSKHHPATSFAKDMLPRFRATAQKLGIDPKTGEEIEVNRTVEAADDTPAKAKAKAERLATLAIKQVVLWMPVPSVEGVIIESKRIC